MVEKQIIKVLKALGSIEFRTNSEGVRTNCPLQWNHARKDKHPSMFIFSSHPKAGKPSVAMCHACNFKGSLSNLIWEVKKQKPELSRELIEYVDRCEAGEDDIELAIDLIPEYEETPNYVKFNKSAQDAIKNNRMLESSSMILNDQSKEILIKEYGISKSVSYTDLEAMISPYLAHVPGYWFERGFDQATAQKWFVGQQGSVYWQKIKGTKRHYMDYGPRLLFGIKDYRQNWVGWSSRAIQPEEKLQRYEHPDRCPIYRAVGHPKYLHAPFFKRNDYLYGEFAIDCKIPICFLCEGFFDVINLSRHGFQNPLGMFGTALSDNQIKKIQQWFDTVIFIPDGDEPGIKAMEEAKKKLSNSVRFISIDPTSYMGRDPGDLNYQEIMNLVIDCL
jgi:hypothetical protein